MRSRLVASCARRPGLALLASIVVVPVLVLPAGAQQPQPEFDLVIRGGRVFDGSGNPWVRADAAVEGGLIVAVGDLPEGASAAREIDAGGLYVMPGVIDMHSHANSGFNGEEPTARATVNNLTQGITTVLIGEGGSAWGADSSIQDLAEEWSRHGIGTNAALLAGIGNIRRQVLGRNDATPTPDQLEEMRALVRAAMEGGAFGVSTALDYWPGHFASTEEIVALAREAARYGGIYVSHMRSEGTRSLWWVESDPSPRVTVLDAIEEIIRVGREAEIPVHILHLKSTGIPFWGKSREAVALIERARAEGVEITANQYPYTSSGPDRNTQLFKWEPYLGEEGGRDLEDEERKAAIAERMAEDPLFARQVEKDVLHEILARGGADRMFVTRFETNPAYVGRSLEEIAALRQETLFETAHYLQFDNDARIQSWSMSEDDLKVFLAQDWVAPATDGSAAGPRAHPRSYGTFPRVLRRYVLDEPVITLPDFVRKVTSFPASILGLEDRGWLREGYRADITVFDPETVRDHATFEDPDVMSDGIEYVLVNGRLAIDAGQYTGELAGEVILRR